MTWNKIGLPAVACEPLEVYLTANGPSHLKDSKDVLNSLKLIGVYEHFLLVTVDVESLYTNIRQTDAMNAVKWAFNKFTNLKMKQKQFIQNGLKLVMTNNYFWYGGQHYNQIKVVSIGTNYAPQCCKHFSQ